MLRPSSLPHAGAVAATVVAAVVATVVTTVMLALPALLGGVAPGAAEAAAVTGARPVEPQQPLVPRIRSMSPDYVPDKGPIVIRGTVTNASDQTWTAINVHGFMGSTPITTADELSDAAKAPVDADVGDRITVAGTFDGIASLAPGETKSFMVRLPHSTLPVTSAGVYWFGVHVLGDNGEGDARVAVGRDRTFIPYVPQSALSSGAQEDTALVLPVRAGVTRAADGSVLDPEEWRRSLRSGALRNIVTTGESAQGQALTWLVDPAVPDVVRRLAHGNPTRSLTGPTGDGPSQSPSPSDSSSSGAASAADSAPSTTARVARTWLKAIHPLLAAETSQLLGLPYGDIDVDSAARTTSPLLDEAFRRTGHALKPWGLSLTRTVSPPNGRIASESLPSLPRDAEVLLPDSGVDDTGSVVNQVGRHEVVLSSAAALEGGPGPAPAQSSLALRQRVLAEAALRVLDEQQPLVVQLPADLEHPLHPSFFSGLDVPWLRLTTLSGATAVTPDQLDASALREPDDADPGLGHGVFDTADDVLSYGATLQSVLTGNHVLRKRLFEEVTGNASYAASVTPYLALARMRETDRWVHGNLDAIDLAAPQSVTLASNSGRFSAIVSNDLDVPVTVRVRAQAEHGLTVTGGEKVSLAPHGRTPVLLHASADQRGVYNVKLELTNAGGQPLGATDTFAMRAEQVSRLIWAIIGVGVVLLFTAIAIRLTRRIIAARAGRGAL